MIVVKCALGVIQERGKKTIAPGVAVLGASERDFLARHVEKVRTAIGAGARSVFQQSAHTPHVLDTLRTASSDGHFAATAKTLQDLLAGTMRTTTNAKDCVFAAVRAYDGSQHKREGETHVTILKLDAVVEAARMKILATEGVTFEVLKDLLPEPGKLQKALSWPDPRSTSDVVMLDTNATVAQYFELAYQVRVSPRSVDAEEELARIIGQRIDSPRVPEVVAKAAELEGPLDAVLEELGNDYPELAEAAARSRADSRPAGIVRRNKVAARPIEWEAAGMQLRVSPDVAATVDTHPTPSGTWILTVETTDRPRPKRID